MYLVYIEYWTVNLMPLMVHPKVPFHLNISTKELEEVVFFCHAGGGPQKALSIVILAEEDCFF